MNLKGPEAHLTIYNVINLQLELKKTVLDRMVHLLSRGCVIPVVTYIKSCWERRDTDISLIRHFVTEVSERVDCFVENEDVSAVCASLCLQSISFFAHYIRYWT